MLFSESEDVMILRNVGTALDVGMLAVGPEEPESIGPRGVLIKAPTTPSYAACLLAASSFTSV